MPNGEGEGRRAWQRRSGIERRVAERRLEDQVVGLERRSEQDRRICDRRDTPDRRSGFDRRTDYPRLTPAPYSSGEAQQIRDMVANRVSRVACPRCNDTLVVGPLFRRGRHRVREVYCQTCRHAVIIHGNSDVRANS